MKLAMCTTQKTSISWVQPLIEQTKAHHFPHADQKQLMLLVSVEYGFFAFHVYSSAMKKHGAVT